MIHATCDQCGGKIDEKIMATVVVLIGSIERSFELCAEHQGDLERHVTGTVLVKQRGRVRGGVKAGEEVKRR